MQICVFIEPQNGAEYEQQLAMAQAAERLGFDGFFRSDHFIAFSGDGLPGPTDSWTTLAGLARETSRIRLGTLVSSATFRLPGVLAIQVAQVDRMSGGRVELGLGTGWNAAEHSAYGIPFPDKRFGLFEEQLEIVTGLWSTPLGETFSFEGDHYRLTDAPALPKPLQSPLPVIIGGGGAQRTPALAARFAREFNIGFTGEQRIAEKFAGARAAAEAHDRDPATLRLSAAATTAVGADRAEFERRVVAGGGDPASFLDGTTLGGSPAEVVDKLGRLAELGAERVYLQLLDLDDLEHLELLAAEVLPHARAL